MLIERFTLGNYLRTNRHLELCTVACTYMGLGHAYLIIYLIIYLPVVVEGKARCVCSFVCLFSGLSVCMYVYMCILPVCMYLFVHLCLYERVCMFYLCFFVSPCIFVCIYVYLPVFVVSLYPVSCILSTTHSKGKDTDLNTEAMRILT